MRLIKIILFLAIAELSAISISGTVVDAESKGISDVLVTCEGHVAFTNDKGFYSLANCSESSIVRFHKIGYQDVELEAKSIVPSIVLDIERVPLAKYEVRSDGRSTDILATVKTTVIKIDSTEISADIAELIIRQSNLQLEGNELAGEGKKIKLPGYDAKHTLITLDGVPLNKGGEAVDLSTIPLNSLARIEINDLQQGNSKGISTRIDLISKSGENRKNNYMLDYMAGSFGLSKISGSANLNWKFWNLWMFASYLGTENNFEYEARDFWENPDSLRTRENNDKTPFKARNTK